jgi:hypothetical protein
MSKEASASRENLCRKLNKLVGRSERNMRTISSGILLENPTVVDPAITVSQYS